MSLKHWIFPFAKREPTPRDRYAGYHERVFAAAIDMCVLFIILNAPFNWLTNIIYGENSPATLLENGTQLTWDQTINLFMSSGAASLAAINFMLQVICIGVLYTAIQHAFGTTAGRFIVGIQLVDAKTERPPTLLQYFRRFLGYFVSLPPLMLGFVWACFDKRRQTLHDKIAGTVMLDLRPRGWYWNQCKYWVRRARGLPQHEVQIPADAHSTLAENTVSDPTATERNHNT